ncbi:hypothetical protein [Bacteroides sp. 224]|uniref:hypothetical protein n=1 Tax=Bacteroides sp. 224 TaxID=2302936 RepID=UPI0013D259A0|nr:hypothetical protein [Bacteroides sp. 224]
MPTIELVDLKLVDNKIAMKLVADKDLERFYLDHGFLLYLGGAYEPDVTYTDRFNKQDSVIIWSSDVLLKTHLVDKYYYEAIIDIKNPIHETNDPIHCRVFMLGFLGRPYYETNAITVSGKSLLEVLNEAKTETPF